MRVWVIDAKGEKHRLFDPFSPCFYIGGPLSVVEPLLSVLSSLNLQLKATPSEGVEFYTGKTIPVTRVEVANPLHFAKVVRLCASTASKPEGSGISLYNCDLALAQLYFFQRGSFPLAFCEVEADVEGRMEGLTLRDSIWKSDYTTPPLSTVALRMEGPGIQPDRAGPRRLEVTIDGRTESIEAENDPDLLYQFDRMMLLNDPDLILSEWGDSYILPQLMATAKKRNLTLLLNREPDAEVIKRRERSYFSDGQGIHQTHLLLGRWHIDLQSSFRAKGGELAGLFEFARLSKIPVQQMARTTTVAGITSMQMDLAFQAGILIPWRKLEADPFKGADRPFRSNRKGLAYSPALGFHEEVAALDLTLIYPSFLERNNISPETIDCSCCPQNQLAEIGVNVCSKREGLIPRFLAPFLERRAEYRRLERTAADPKEKARYHGCLSAINRGLAGAFGAHGYQNARFGKIGERGAIAAHLRRKLLEGKKFLKGEGFEIIHEAVDALWIKKPGTTEVEYEALADGVSQACGLPIGLEGVYRWVVFPLSTPDLKLGPAHRYLGVLSNGETKLRGIEASRGDSAPFIRKAQLEMIEILSEARNIKEYQALIPKVMERFEACRALLRSGEIPPWDLAISKILSQAPEEYPKESLIATVAKELTDRGVKLVPGQSIAYILTHDKAAAPARAFGFIDGPWRYDAKKYEALLTEAVEAILPPSDLFILPEAGGADRQAVGAKREGRRSA